MAKAKTPLLSFGARGTIANSLTFQKRGQATIARKKPVPEDPKSPAQLTQRQVYRDAVALWHSLMQEEKEAWRGVCRGLTAYQCFLRSELKYVEPTPPPEEYTEEQPVYNYEAWGIFSDGDTRAGQKLNISNRQVIKLGFWLKKKDNPTGNVAFTIRKVSNDDVLLSKDWGDAATLPTEITYKEVTFDTPQTINEEVRICCEFSGGDSFNKIIVALNLGDIKPDECFTVYEAPSWNDLGYDCAYRYKYYEV
ncbi:hypothetical protein ES708_22958 [subsurface metagenome]